MVGKLTIGDQIRETHIRFRNTADYENYIDAIDQYHESEDAFFTGYVFKRDTLQFNLVNRSQYGKDCVFKHELFEYRGNNCCIPTKDYCFVNSINYLTDEDYKQHYLDFIRTEKIRSNVKIKARIQPFCRANNINSCYFDGVRFFPRSVSERIVGLSLYNNHFCLICKSEGIGFNQGIEELKNNFKIVDNFITEENDTFLFKYEFIA